MIHSRLDRVVVVGTSGSGKTNLAKRLSRALQAPHIELDALHWGPDWAARAPERFRSLVVGEVAGSRWIVDGNYSVVRDIVWRRATTLVWLNYGFGVVFLRALRRTARRTVMREELWAGNRESLIRSFFTRDSILWWVIRTYRRRRREYPRLLQSGEFAHLEVLEFRKPAHAEEFLARLEGIA